MDIIEPDSQFPVDLPTNGETLQKQEILYFNTKNYPIMRLVQYPESKNSIVLCCTFFGSNCSKLSENGINNWKYIGK